MSADPLSPSGTWGHRLAAWDPGVALPGTASHPPAFAGLRIAALVGERLRAGLAHEAELVAADVEEVRADLILVEGGPELGPAGAGGDAAVDRVLAAARRRKVPAVLWHTQDLSFGDRFDALAKTFDFVFCADARVAERLRADGIRAEWLPPAVQPRIHNPFRDFVDLNALDTGVLYDGLIDLFAGGGAPDVLRRALPHGLRVIDSQSQVFRSKLKNLGEFAGAALGCTDREGAVLALKYARAALFLDGSVRTRTSQQWAVLEAAACRLPVFHVGALPQDDPRCGIVTEIADAAALEEILGRVMTDDLERRRLAQPGWRKVQLEHTFGQRLRDICTAAGVRTDWAEYRAATLVTPSRRIELLGRCLDTFRRQSWPAKDLVLVVNRNTLEGAEAIIGDVRPGEAVQIVNVPEERYAGACLNVGNALARGEYCFRVDDDDYYGDHYITDMMLHLRCVDADVVGKPPRYAHFEEEGVTYARPPRVPELTFLPPERCARCSLWLGGNSLGGRREVLMDTPYPDRAFGAADTIFLMTAGQKGLRIASLDELNMVASRREGGDHTWTLSADDLKRKSRALEQGIAHLMV